MTSFYERSQLQLATESIHDQKKSKYKKLENIAYNMILRGREGMQPGDIEEAFAGKLESEVRTLFNIQLGLFIEPGTFAASVKYEEMSLNNSLTADTARSDINEILTDKNAIKDNYAKLAHIHKRQSKPITADLSNARLRCKYGQVSAIMRIGYEVLRAPGITQARLTAIWLHEIGHVFNSIIYANSFDIQLHNLTLAGNSIRDIKGPNARIEMIGELASNQLLTDEQAEAFRKNPNGVRFPLDLTARLTDNVRKKIVGLSSANQEYEKLADTFAVRCGYGPELAATVSMPEGSIIQEPRSLWDRVGDYMFIVMVHSMNIVLRVCFLFVLYYIRKDDKEPAHLQASHRREHNIQDELQRGKFINHQNEKELSEYIDGLRSMEIKGFGLGTIHKLKDIIANKRSHRKFQDIGAMMNNTLYADMLELKLLNMQMK